MSDTPRTDAFLKAGDGARVVRCSYSDLERLVLSVADFARVLERELAELRDLYNVTRGLIPGAKEAVRPEVEPQWTSTYLGKIEGGETWACAVPPCWLLIDDVLHPEREPWPRYWDGQGWPINCTSYRIIGYYKTPTPPAGKNALLPQQEPRK